MTTSSSTDIEINNDGSTRDTSKRLTNILLNGPENYMIWSRRVTISLRALSKLGHINGEIKKINENEPGFEDWHSDDCLVMCWLLNSMEENLAHIYVYSDSCLHLWNRLKGRFGPRNTHERIFDLKQEIANTKQGTQSVAEYFGCMKAKWDELAFYLPKTTDLEILKTRAKNEKVYQLLAGLNPKFGLVQNQILLSPELPSEYKVLDMLRCAETIQKIMNPDSVQTSNEPNEANGGKNGGRGRGRGGQAATAWCDHCHKAGHAKERCWWLYPHLRPTKGSSGINI